MKKIILVFALFILTSFNVEKEVYICVSKGAKKYHYSESCRGLSACTHEIKKVTISNAKSLGLDLCGWED